MILTNHIVFQNTWSHVIQPKQLKQDHPILFECLQVTIMCLTTWSESDVNRNQNGGIQKNDVNALLPEFGKIVGTLKQPCWYKVHNLNSAISSTLTLNHSDKWSQRQPGFLSCMDVVLTHIEHVFQVVPDNVKSDDLVCPWEVAVFYSLLWCFNNDVYI